MFLDRCDGGGGRGLGRTGAYLEVGGAVGSQQPHRVNNEFGSTPIMRQVVVGVKFGVEVVEHRGRSVVRDCTIAPHNCAAGVIQQVPSPMLLATGLVDLQVLVHGEVRTEGCSHEIRNGSRFQQMLVS